MESDSCQETFERFDQDRFRIFTNKTITWATFLGSALAGGLLMAHNYRKWGETKNANKAILFSVALTAVILGVALQIPDEVNVPSSAFTIPQMFVISWLVHTLQGGRIQEHIDDGGKKGSFLIATGVSVTTAAVVVGCLFGYDALHSRQFGQLQTYNQGDEVYFDDGASSEDADLLATELKEFGWFGDHYATSVRLERREAVFVVSLMLADDAWNDPDNEKYWQDMNTHLQSGPLGNRTVLQLCNDEFLVKRTLDHAE